MNGVDFPFYRDLLLQRSGLTLAENKAYLLESRLAGIVRRHALSTMAELTTLLRTGDEAMIHAVIDAMTTNETSFFRDGKPFEAFRLAVLPDLMARRCDRRSLRILSAGAATGQEPYSLAMLLLAEAGRLAGWRCEIVAIDISAESLAKARSGVFSAFEVQRGLSPAMLATYFERLGNDWRIADVVREMVTFREHNLLSDLASLGGFDVIFCRNVLIYFAPATKTETLHRLHRALAADGYLLLGGTETVMGLTNAFVAADGQPCFYRPGLSPPAPVQVPAPGAAEIAA
jgi:chemotaxis protein methyltransferase CheR